MVLFSEAEQLKVEARSLDSAEFIERYKRFEAEVNTLAQREETVRNRVHGYVPDIVATKVCEWLMPPLFLSGTLKITIRASSSAISTLFDGYTSIL